MHWIFNATSTSHCMPLETLKPSTLSLLYLKILHPAKQDLSFWKQGRKCLRFRANGLKGSLTKDFGELGVEGQSPKERAHDPKVISWTSARRHERRFGLGPRSRTQKQGVGFLPLVYGLFVNSLSLPSKSKQCKNPVPDHIAITTFDWP